MRRALVVCVLDCFILLDREFLDLLFEIRKIWWLHHRANTQASTSFVDDVDALVWLHATWDVATAEFHRDAQCFIGDLHAVMLLVLRTNALEDLEGLLGVWWFDSDRLEATLKRGIFLDVFAVFIEGRRTDALNLAARERWLEHVRRIDRAFCAASANKRVQLIDKQNDVLRTTDFVHDSLDALFELTAVLRARNHECKIEHDKSSIVQQIRHFLIDDALRETFHDRRLSNARFAEQHRVVLRATAEDLNESFDFVGAADHRIEFASLRKFGEIASETVERGSLALRWSTRCARLARGGSTHSRTCAAHGAFVRFLWRCSLLVALSACAEKVEDFLTNLFKLETEIHEYLCSHAVVFTEKAEQKMLRADIVVIEIARFFDRVFDDFLRARRLRKLAHGHHLGTTLHKLLDFKANLAQINVEVLEHVGANARAFLHEAKQNVLSPDVLMVESLGFLVGKRHHFARTVG